MRLLLLAGIFGCLQVFYFMEQQGCKNCLCMKRYLRKLLLIFGYLSFSGVMHLNGQDLPASFGNEKTTWHEGFDRYDFLMDTASFSIEPMKAPEGSTFGVGEPAKGKRRCILIVPKKAAPGNPWSWRGCYWDHQPQTETELLRRGFYIAYISASGTLKPGPEWDAWYTFLTEKHGLSAKPAFIGMSRGGEYAYIWATTHPDKVSCIYADNPGMNRTTLMKLGELAKNDVPLLQVCGSIDPIFGDNALFIENLYQQLGGRLSMLIKDGAAHHPHSLPDPRPIADWIEQNSVAAMGSAPPAFAGDAFKKTYYYSTRNDYHYFPEEKAYLTRRGASFSPCYDRYAFNIKGVQGPVVVIVPKKEAPGRPWVFRAGFGDRDAEMDLALLARGFHIVTGPVSFNSDSLLLKDWNATYELLVSNGLSKKPVMEGAGGAAGEVIGWAIENPDKVSGIYAENPLLRSTFSKTPPLENLAPLTRAGVPLLQVCGSLDPALKDNALLIEKRYKQLGGKIQVILKESKGHYPLAPEDPGPIADLIANWQSR